MGKGLMYTFLQQAHRKIFNTIDHKVNGNQKHSEIPLIRMAKSKEEKLIVTNMSKDVKQVKL